MSATNLYTLKN